MFFEITNFPKQDGVGHMMKAFFWIQTLGIHIPILPGSEIESIPSACHLNSIQLSLCKKAMIHT